MLAFRFGDRKGAWHRARGRDLLAFQFEIAKGAWHLTRGRDLPAFRFGITKVPGTGRRDEICKHFDSGFAKVPGTNGTGTNGTVRLGAERKFSSGTWKIFVILPRALAIDDDFKNLPWLKSRTFLASSH